jgi:hypothetical protein
MISRGRRYLLLLCAVAFSCPGAAGDQVADSFIRARDHRVTAAVISVPEELTLHRLPK